MRSQAPRRIVTFAKGRFLGPTSGECSRMFALTRVEPGTVGSVRFGRLRLRWPRAKAEIDRVKERGRLVPRHRRADEILLCQCFVKRRATGHRAPARNSRRNPQCEIVCSDHTA